MPSRGLVVTIGLLCAPLIAVDTFAVSRPNIANSSDAEALMWGTRNVIVVGGDYNFPPYEYLDDDDRPAGYNVEITQAIAEVMGIDIEIVLGGWDEMREAFNEGRIDVLQGMTVTEERQQTLIFSPPNVMVQQSIFARLGTPSVTSLNDLRGKKIIVQSQGSMHDYLLANEFDVEIVPVSTHVDTLRLLSSGKHDYAIGANLPGLYLGKELGLSNIRVVGKPFVARGYTYAVVKGNEALLAQFSEGLAILKNTGRQQEIYDKWLGVLEERQSILWRQFGLAAALLSVILFLIIGVVTIWNRALKIQVDKRTAELRDHQKQLIQADKMSSLGVLVSGVAHEINNPTSLMLLNLPLFSDVWRDLQSLLDEHYKVHPSFQLGGLSYSRIRDELPIVIDEMNGGAFRIKRIVEDLKDFARNSKEDNDELIDVNDVAYTAMRLVENSIRKSTNNFTMNCRNDIPPVYANTQRIEQVVVNLLLNACQSLDSHEGSVSIETLYDNKKQQVSIVVEDEGCGISQANMDRLTDPFFTTKRESGGTGLGLSVSAGIAKSHGGYLEFSSQQNIGTIATLILPVRENDSE